jgi:hypothetical protein
MAKWIVETFPIPHRSGETAIDRKEFFTDNAAKAFVRDARKLPNSVRVTSAPNIKPSINMDDGDSLRWAHS